MEPPPPVSGTSPGAEYTCPMHPGVQQVGPGACPLCGMGLEPVAAGSGGPDPELVDMTRRFKLAALLTLPVLALAMGAHLLPHLFDPVPPQVSAWLQLLLATPVVLWAGAPFFTRAWTSVRTRHLNMFTLVALGTGASWAVSVVAVLVPGVFPSTFRGADGGVEVYFEPAAVITTLVLLGQVLELRARERTSSAVRSLLDLTPPTAHRVERDGSERDVRLTEVALDDVVRVRPGEKVPVDGTVTSGRAALDESMVTGEPMPVTKEAGSAVVAGTLVSDGSLLVRTSAVGGDTILARVVELVSSAQRSRASVQARVDQVARVFVPVVILTALAAAMAWVLLGPAPALSNALVVAVSVLVIACPCALGLATPMSVMVGVGRAARAGALVRNVEAMELLSRVDTVVLDKTGTLTQGRPRLVDVLALPGADPTLVLRVAAALERGSEHPLARAVVAAAEASGLTSSVPVEGFTSRPGRGVMGTVDGRTVLVGNADHLRDNGIDSTTLVDLLKSARHPGATASFVAIDDAPAAALLMDDPVRATAREAIEVLVGEGIEVSMMTGDTRGPAEEVGRQVGITRVEASMTPGAKHDAVRALKADGRVVAMVGDGVNDAPALALADVGVAIGTGSDVALESAGVTLLRADLRTLVDARRVSRATTRNIRQNLVLAFAYNAVGIPVAAGVLYPATGLLLSPAIAAAAMALSSLSVIANALRLSRTA